MNRCQACLDTFTDASLRFLVWDQGTRVHVCETCVGWYRDAINVTPADVQARHDQSVDLADVVNQWD